MQSNRSLFSFSILTSLFIGISSGFVVQPLTVVGSSATAVSSTLLAAATRRKKESMAEKRARRKARQQREINLPERSRKVVLADESFSAEDDSSSSDASPPQQAEKASASGSMTKAQELIERQRRSVAMLTLVKERIEELPAEDVVKALADQGYYVVNNFLNDEETLQELEQEAVTLLENGMTADMENLASGEYLGPVKGGEEQYAICPRSVELVVSTTKHFGSMVVPGMNLDSANCLGRMRTFDRRAFDAAKGLLTQDAAAVEETLGTSQSPFQRLVDLSDTSDKRRLSLRYYLVPSEWKFGGGIEFENHGLVEAARDRLVVWKTAETPMRKQPWKGDEWFRFGSCLELDLIQTAQQ